MHLQETARTYIKRNYFEICRESPKTYIDQRCRSEMISWMKKVADCLGFSNITVLYSADYVDRFLSQDAAVVHKCLSSRRVYQLLTMTCFYVAVKIHEPKVISLDLLVQMSSFMEKDFEEMELQIMKTLDWNLYGPLAISFIDLYLDLIIPPSKIIKGICIESIKEQVLLLATEELLNIELDDSIVLCRTPSQLASEAIRRINATLIAAANVSSSILPISILKQIQNFGIGYDTVENMHKCCASLISSTNYDFQMQSCKQEMLETEFYAPLDCVSKIDRRLSIERS